MRPLLVAFAMLLLVPSRPWAHEVPSRVAVQMYVHPDGRTVRVLVRVPVVAMRDIEFPSRGAFLDVARADSALFDAARIWVADAITLSAGDAAPSTGRILSVRAALPTDRAFESYAAALEGMRRAPLPENIDIVAAQAMLDVMLEFPVAYTEGALAIAPRLAHLGVKTSTVLRFVPVTGEERALVYEGDPGVVQLSPLWIHAASRFVRMGVEHLLDGLDHLLFLLCLIIPVRRVRPLIGIVTAFTIAHSLTLAASAMGFAPDALWFPPLVEVLIAASIVFMAIENIVGAKLERRWLIAFGFGLVHGFGFSFALRDSLQFAGSHLITALAAFNVGIELGQLLVLAVAVPVFAWVAQRMVNERAGVIIGSVMIAHTAWHWMTARFDALRTYHFSWPALDISFAIGAIRLLMGVLIVGGVVWGISGVMTRLNAPRASRTTAMLLLVMSAAFGGLVLATPSRAEAQARSTMAGVYTADQAKKGREVFAGTCSGCHTVASHSGAVFAIRWMGRPLADFYDYVSHLMPKSAPGTLSEDEYVWVTAYVLKLNGMPASTRELSAEPALLKAIRIDTLLTASGKPGSDAGPRKP